MSLQKITIIIQPKPYFMPVVGRPTWSRNDLHPQIFYL